VKTILTSERFYFKRISKKTGLCPQVRQTEPKNEDGLADAGRSRPIYWASGGKNGVGRWISTIKEAPLPWMAKALYCKYLFS